jgi:TRAP-type C4-dicarboxylate transport system permease small subunit
MKANKKLTLRAVFLAIWNSGVEAWAVAAGMGFVLLSMMIVFDVIGRKYFGVSTRATVEIGGYVLAVCGTMAVAYTVRHEAHIRISLLISQFSPTARQIADWSASVATAGLLAFWLSAVWRVVDLSLVTDAHSPTLLYTPLWIPQILWAGAIAVATLFALVIVLRDSWRLWKLFWASGNTEGT